MTAVVRLVCRCCWPGLVVPGKGHVCLSGHLSGDPCHAPLVTPHLSWARKKLGVCLNSLSLLSFDCAVCCSAQSRLTLQPHGLQPARLLCPWDSPGNNTGAGRPALLQGICPTQGSNSSLLPWQASSSPLAPPGL